VHHGLRVRVRGRDRVRVRVRVRISPVVVPTYRIQLIIVHHGI
jgi:hypothetical protein